MTSTLVCLLSDQRMQNVIPLFQRGLHFDRVILIASADRQDKINDRYRKIFEDTRTAFHDCAQWELHPQAVDPMSPESTRLVCLNIIRICGVNHTTINFTGGTKPMSIGAYQAALDMGVSKMYIDTQAEQLFLYHGADIQKIAFSLNKISTRQYLRAHGKIINENATSALLATNQERAFAAAIYANRPQSLQIMTILRSLTVSSDNHALTVEKLPQATWLKPALNDLGAHFQDGLMHLDNQALRFFNGGWLETYTLHALEITGRFMNVSGNIKLSGIENELDVACTLNGKLAIIECKTGNIQKGNSEAQKILNRLKALKESLSGTFGKSFLVITQDIDGKQFIDRAAEYVSRVIGMKDLDRAEEIIYEEMAIQKR